MAAPPEKSFRKFFITKGEACLGCWKNVKKESPFLSIAFGKNSFIWYVKNSFFVNFL